MIKDSLKRQEAVLEIVIRHYIETAEPVGSRYVARKLGLSSATIRNVMSDLEEASLIMQPFTSAGRIPTDRGYRYYIDTLMRARSVNEHTAEVVAAYYHQAVRSLEDVLEKTSHLMSSLTHYVGVTLFTEYGKVYWDGSSAIMEHPEFKDVKKLYNLLHCLEEKRDILTLLQGDRREDKTSIQIGKEIRLHNLCDCSVVTRGYKVKGKPGGKVGVIGPKRMVYEKVIPTVEYLADTLTNLLERIDI